MFNKRMTAISILVAVWVFFIYYTVWILVTPALDENHWMQNHFPDRTYGILPTSLLAYMILAFMFTFSGVALIKDSAEKQAPPSSMTPTDCTSTPNTEQKTKSD